MTRIHVPIALRWSDLDAYGHVNNARLLGLLEEARIAAFWSTGGDSDPATAVLDGHPSADTVTLIGRLEVEYLAPIPYLREPIDIHLWLGRLGGASLEVCYEVWTPAGQEPATVFARAATTIVLVDATSGTPRRMSDVERDAMTPYLGESITFQRR